MSFLVASVGVSVADAGRLAKQAVREAWHSIDERHWRRFHVDHAGRTLAAAAAALVRGVLQGVVAFLVAKGANAAASRVPELVTKLRASRLGEGFAAWVERNWETLIKRLQRAETVDAQGSGGGGAGSSSLEQCSAEGETTTGRAAGSRTDSSAPAKSAPSKPQPERSQSEALTSQQKTRAQNIGKTAVQNSNGSVRKGLA